MTYLLTYLDKYGIIKVVGVPSGENLKSQNHKEKNEMLIQDYVAPKDTLIGYTEANQTHLKELMDSDILNQREVSLLTIGINCALHGYCEDVNEFLNNVVYGIEDTVERIMYPVFISHETEFEHAHLHQLTVLGYDTGFYVWYDETQYAYRFFHKSDAYWMNRAKAGMN